MRPEEHKKLLIFDVYGTLISTGTGSIEATKKILGLQDNEIDAEEFYGEWKKLHRIHMDEVNEGIFITEEEIFVQDLKLLYEKYGIVGDYRNDVKYMLDSLVGRVFFDDVKEVLEKLRKSYRVVLGSTTDTAPLLENLNENSLMFDAIYTSERIGKYKPDRYFYEYILEQEGYDVSDTTFIGDSLVDDVYGPQQVGIKTILIDRLRRCEEKNSQIIPEMIIYDFNELLDLGI